jgi:CheY-like chemotaxis protein
MDGREALAEIKSDPDLKQIPVVVLTTSQADQDVLQTYELGGNSFITKPVTFAGLVEVMRSFTRYWFELVELPAGEGERGNGRS